MDVSDPTDLTYITSVPTAFIPEGSTEPVSIQPNDIVLSSDGRYALITSSGGATQVITIDIEKREVASMTSFVLQDGSSGEDFSPVFNAVESAPDGTIIAPGTSLTTMLLQDDGSLAFGTLTQVYIDPYGGVHDAPGTDTKAPSIMNIFVAPDGKTVLAPDSLSLESRLASPPAPEAGVPFHYPVFIYTITAPGQLAYQGVVTLTRAIQSIAYNDNGAQAYAVGNNGIAIIGDFIRWDNVISDFEYIELDSVSVLNINAPGNVTIEKENAVTLYQRSVNQHFGVDVVAYGRGKLVVGNLSKSNQFGGYLNVFRVVDLSSYETTWLPTGGGPLFGTRVLPLQKRLFLPLVLLGSAAP
ncbi:MAG TPA: hypothetical protein PKW33_17070 [Anaerolineaceae bacterium]|nr:hypothetical protein [Anaerolineaceae bacterium]HPN53311.1 hypothetical protein [Anaerolineaceae bacterium]